MMRWTEAENGMVAYGKIKHKIWRAVITSGFYAKSGLDLHGPYKTASEARAACCQIDFMEGKE